MFIKDENYIVIHGWMRKKLGLKGNDLLVYAVLYGFSQDGESEFRGTIDYVMDFIGSGRRTVIRSLQILEQIGYVKRIERNLKEGKTNGYICVPLNQVGVCQNDTPPVCQNDTPGMPNCHPPCAKMTHPPYIIENKEINKEVNKEYKKESKKVDNKEDIYILKKQTYDEILKTFDFSEDTKKSVGEFLKYCKLNKHLLTNDDFIRFLENLKTYDISEQRLTIQKAKDKGYFMINPKTELHYDVMGVESFSSKQTFENIIESELFNFSDVIKMWLWKFIRHRGAIKAPITNDSLHSLCTRLRFDFLTEDDDGRVKAIKDAIDGGYRNIKIEKHFEYSGELLSDMEGDYGQ